MGIGILTPPSTITLSPSTTGSIIPGIEQLFNKASIRFPFSDITSSPLAISVDITFNGIFN